MTQCIACGMPMENPEDFAMNDETKNYCRFCSNSDGTMQNFEQKLTSLTDFIIKTQGIDKKVAEKTAKDMMRKLPAWKDHFND